MKRFSHLTIHPRLVAVFDLLFGLVFLVLLSRVNSLIIFAVWALLHTVLTAALVMVTYYPDSWKRYRHLLSLLLFNVGMTLFLLFTEWPVAWEALGAVYIFVPAISFWLIPSRGNSLSFEVKPYRRWRLMMSWLGLAGLWTGIFASITLNIFQFNFWLWLLVGAVVSSLLAWWWWTEYEVGEASGRTGLWVLGFFLMTLELSWVFYLLPFGYFVSGLILAWIWYWLWMLIRFYLSSAGIDWKKQGWLLVINTTLILLFLGLLVRWR